MDDSLLPVKNNSTDVQYQFKWCNNFRRQDNMIYSEKLTAYRVAAQNMYLIKTVKCIFKFLLPPPEIVLLNRKIFP